MKLYTAARFPRSLSEAFKGADYGCAIEVYRLPLLQRVFRLLSWR